MSEEYTLGLGKGLLIYKNGNLTLNGQPLQELIMKTIRPFVLNGEYDFGMVDIRIAFDDYDSCPHCHSIVRKTQMENKKAQFAVPLGILSGSGDIISPDALNLSTLPSKILDENGVVVGEVTDAAIDGDRLLFTVEHCDEFIERLKKRGTWTITSTVKSSDC